jgi:hypothetical protein
MFSEQKVPLAKVQPFSETVATNLQKSYFQALK